ncbi:bcl-2-like protein 2 isoform X1 [Lampetra planeri]
MSDPYNNREIVNDFIRYKLTQRGYGQSGPSPPPPPPSSPPPPPSSQSTAQLLRVLRAAGDEFESRYRASFSDLSQQLHVSQGCAEQRFAEVTAELFRDGVNWGRVVAFLAFGAALCAECADKEMGFLVDGIAQWMANYLDEELRDWIQQNGGWLLRVTHVDICSWATTASSCSAHGPNERSPAEGFGVVVLRQRMYATSDALILACVADILLYGHAKCDVHTVHRTRSISVCTYTVYAG